MTQILLPSTLGASEPYRMRADPLKLAPGSRFNRIAFSAAHVVADPCGTADPGGTPVLDWDATLTYRRYLIGLGMGIAEAMDTAQRGMGLDWRIALELVGRTLAGTRDLEGAMVYSGCGTDQLAPEDARSIDDVLRAYDEQITAIQKLGGRLIVMASRALARVARNADDYATVYRKVLSRAEHPVILHWLGDMFDPALSGYWGSQDFDEAMSCCLRVMDENADRIDGIKISLLDKDKEIRMRRLLPEGTRMYTGDDFNYPELIAGDEQGYSDALLGIFDAIAPAASAALAALAAGNRQQFFALLAPTVPLSRRIFRAPTQHYKTGVVFLAYLNGHQDHMIMVNGAQSSRPLADFVEIFKLADQAGLLRDPELAASRMGEFLRLYGFR